MITKDHFFFFPKVTSLYRFDCILNFLYKIWINPIKMNVTFYAVVKKSHANTSVSARLWNLQDNYQFYQNLIIKLNFYKVLQDNLRNRGSIILRPVSSWITAILLTSLVGTEGGSLAKTSAGRSLLFFFLPGPFLSPKLVIAL